MTPQELRRHRLAADYEEMRSIRGKIIHWEANRGSQPHFDQYLLTVRIRTIIGRGPDYASEIKLRLDLPALYPMSAPVIAVREPPFPFHPNWWANGSWCYGTWAPGEGLGRYVIRMARTLQFDPGLTNLDSPANREAVPWWSAFAQRGLFPTDRQTLPDPTVKRSVRIVSS